MYNVEHFWDWSLLYSDHLSTTKITKYRNIIPRRTIGISFLDGLFVAGVVGV